MGMDPGARLLYGINIGEWGYDEPEESDPVSEGLPWLTWERWKESYEIETVSYDFLQEHGLEGVSLNSYGSCDHPRWMLASRGTGCSGWGDTTTVTADKLRVTDDDDRLMRAWALIFPGQPVPAEPAWILSATFG